MSEKEILEAICEYEEDPFDLKYLKAVVSPEKLAAFLAKHLSNNSTEV